MSLLTDKFFYNALKTSSEVKAIVGERIFNPARPTVDEDEDRIPYIIITSDGLQNTPDMKDDDVEGEEDEVTISILCVSESCDSLGDLTELVRSTCRDYWKKNNNDYLTPLYWTFSASQVSLDPEKPCCFQTLTYQCTTSR